MYYVFVPDEHDDVETREDAVKAAKELMDSGDYTELYVVRVVDKFTNSVQHEVIDEA